MSSDLTVVAVVLAPTRLQFASSTYQPTSTSWQPQWQKCVEVVLPKSSDPVHIVEQLCAADPSVILVCRPELRSLLLRRYAHDMVVLVDESGLSKTSKVGRAGRRRAFWWTFVPDPWKPSLDACWQVADMTYSYCRQCTIRQDTTTSLFDRYRYRPATPREDIVGQQRDVQPTDGIDSKTTDSITCCKSLANAQRHKAG